MAEHPRERMLRSLIDWIESYRAAGKPLPNCPIHPRKAATVDLNRIAAETGIPIQILKNVANPLRKLLDAAVGELGITPSPADQVYSQLDRVLKNYEAQKKPLPRHGNSPSAAALAVEVGCDAEWFQKLPRMRARIKQALAIVGLDDTHITTTQERLASYLDELREQGRGLPATYPSSTTYSIEQVARDANVDVDVLRLPEFISRLADAEAEIGLSRPEWKYGHAVPNLLTLIQSWRSRALPVPCSPQNLAAPDYESLAASLDVPKFALWHSPLAEHLKGAIQELGIGPHVDLGTLPRASVTYKELLERAADSLPDNLASSTWAVYKSQLRTFMAACGKTEDDVVGAELGSRFHLTVDEWAQAQAFPPRRVQQLRSALGLFARAHGSLARAAAIPGDFREALRMLVSQPGVVRAHVEATIGVNAGIMENWLRGNSAPRGSEEAVRGIEKYFALPEGTLTSLVTFNPRLRRTYCPRSLFPEPYRGKTNSMYRLRMLVKHRLPDNFEELSDAKRELLVRQTTEAVVSGQVKLPFRARMLLLGKRPYRYLYEDWPTRLKEEWDGAADSLVHFKTAPTPPRGMQRHSAWMSPQTAQKNLQDIQLYFGWLVLDADTEDPLLRGKGMDPDSLTFALLLDTDLTEEYLNWRALRSNGYNGQTLTFLQMCKAHLSSRGGWLYQRPDYLGRVISRLDVAAPPKLFEIRPKTARALRDHANTIAVWHELCNEAHARYSQIDADFRNVRNGQVTVKQTRDPFEPILPILEAPSPIAYLVAMHQIMRHEAGRLDTHLRRHTFMQLVLSQLLTLYPLRASHWAKLTYSSDNSGHLKRYDDNGNVRYEIHFNREEFKNSYSAVFGRPDAPLKFVGVVDGDLARDLDRYLEVCRPLFLKGRNHNHVFVGSKGNPASGPTIYSIIKNATGRFLAESGPVGLRVKGVHPFGPHAYRHIIGTNAIKATGSVESAANILLDSVAVTRKNYIRFLPQERMAQALTRVTLAQGDLSEHINDILSTTRRQEAEEEA